MLDLKGISKTLAKLDDQGVPGHVDYHEGRKHPRVSYILEGTEVFSFGLKRGSAAKSMEFDYVPRQMGLKRKEYRDLHDCPMSKEEYNKKLIASDMT
jgi:hypothetical protein